jgi:hypothetical protein
MRAAPFIAAAVATGAIGVVAAAAAATPGGPAPKALAGTWRTTLTSADLHRLKGPDSTKVWTIIIVNSRYLSYARALGFGPASSGRDSVPFGVTGHKLYLSCLNADGAPSRGYATYSWQVAGGSLRFTKVSEPCSDRILRNRIVILTSHPWRHA